MLARLLIGLCVVTAISTLECPPTARLQRFAGSARNPIVQKRHDASANRAKRFTLLKENVTLAAKEGDLAGVKSAQRRLAAAEKSNAALDKKVAGRSAATQRVFAKARAATAFSSAVPARRTLMRKNAVADLKSSAPAA